MMNLVETYRIIISEVKNKEKQAEIEKRLDKGESSSIAMALEISN